MFFDDIREAAKDSVSYEQSVPLWPNDAPDLNPTNSEGHWDPAALQWVDDPPDLNPAGPLGHWDPAALRWVNDVPTSVEGTAVGPKVDLDDLAGPLRSGHWDPAALRYVDDGPSTTVEGIPTTHGHDDPSRQEDHDGSMSQRDGNGNGIPNEYGDGPDLDGNGVPDDIGIFPDMLRDDYPDKDGDGIPDWDGNGNGIPNEYGDGPDLDGNGVPDEIGINPDILQPGYSIDDPGALLDLDAMIDKPPAYDPSLDPVDFDKVREVGYQLSEQYDPNPAFEPNPYLVDDPSEYVALNPQPLPPDPPPDRFEYSHVFDPSEYVALNPQPLPPDPPPDRFEYSHVLDPGMESQVVYYQDFVDAF
jgi:hypothetical protein